MRYYITKRILSTIPLLLCISFICFCFISLIPSDPAEVALRVRQVPVITPEAVEEVRRELGLDKPFLIRYADWVISCLHGDFGISYTNPSRTVAGELLRCMPATLLLAGASFVLVIFLSIPIGFFCAVYKDSWFDKIMRAFIFMTTAMPENMKQDYVLYANVRGLPQRLILTKHILRNSMHTCFVAIGMSIPQLIAGTIVVENVFAWPGLGTLCIESIFNRDYPVVQAYVLLIGALFVIFNLIFDILQTVIDPRLRREVQ